MIMTKGEAISYLQRYQSTMREAKLIYALDMAIKSLILEVTRENVVGDVQFTDAECRIFLSAMCREMRICSQLDKEAITGDCDVLSDICRSIICKVKDVLFEVIEDAY